MLKAIVWMLRAVVVGMLRAIVWMLRAIVWMFRAIVWMLRAIVGMLRAPACSSNSQLIWMGTGKASPCGMKEYVPLTLNATVPGLGGDPTPAAGRASCSRTEITCAKKRGSRSQSREERGYMPAAGANR
eukprot:1457678-Pyramimonas_sp.AAC.1